MRLFSTLIYLLSLAQGYAQEPSHKFDADFTESMIGKTAPKFVATALDGKQIALENFRGRIVLLSFWSLSCGACFKELPELNALLKFYPTDRFTIISVMDNSKEELLRVFEVSEQFYKLKRLVHNNDRVDFQIIPDGIGIMKDYTNERIFPRLFIIDSNGKIDYHLLGYAEKLGIPGEITNDDRLKCRINRLLHD